VRDHTENSQRQPTTTLLQITDLHILPGEGDEMLGADTFLALQTVLDDAQQTTKPDATVATGDLTQDGSEASYARLRGLLLQTGLPVYALPGNHDIVENMASALAGGMIKINPVHEIGGWRLVMLDRHIDGKLHGALDLAQITILKNALATASGPVVACMHHGPDARCADPGCHLHDDGVLRDILEGSDKLRVLLGGHTHMVNESRIGATSFYSTPATCVQAHHKVPFGDEPAVDFLSGHDFEPTRHGYRTLTISPDGQLETEVHFVEAAA
jgi:Icc protein